MASATGVPDAQPVTIESRENEPLLGQPSDATQKPDRNILYNLVTGTTNIAQAGIWILAALVWSNVLAQPFSLFTPHPLLAVSAILLQVQATLILQPTATPQQKLVGTRIHAAIQFISIVCFLCAFIIIEVHKGDHPHFVSPHGVLGLTTAILIILQGIVGVIQYFLPVTVLGSVDAGKRLYKYHRWTGYVLLMQESATVLAATQTWFNLAALRIPVWAVVVALILTLVGIGARIKKHKLGL